MKFPNFTWKEDVKQLTNVYVFLFLNLESARKNPTSVGEFLFLWLLRGH